MSPNAYGSLLVSSHPSSRARATTMTSSNTSASPTGVHLPAFILRGHGLFSGRGRRLPWDRRSHCGSCPSPRGARRRAGSAKVTSRPGVTPGAGQGHPRGHSAPAPVRVRDPFHLTNPPRPANIRLRATDGLTVSRRSDAHTSPGNEPRRATRWRPRCVRFQRLPSTTTPLSDPLQPCPLTQLDRWRRLPAAFGFPAARGKPSVAPSPSRAQRGRPPRA